MMTQYSKSIHNAHGHWDVVQLHTPVSIFVYKYKYKYSARHHGDCHVPMVDVCRGCLYRPRRYSDKTLSPVESRQSRKLDALEFLEKRRQAHEFAC